MEFLKKVKFLVIASLIMTTFSLADISWSSGWYDDSLYITKKLSINGASSLQVSINGETEEKFDYLYIYDSNNNLIAKLDGVISENLIVNSSYINLIFTSDCCYNREGVNVTIKNLDKTSNLSLSTDNKNISVTDIPNFMRQKGWVLAPKLMEHWFDGSGSIYEVDIEDIEDLSSDVKDAIEEWEEDAENGNLIKEYMKEYIIAGLKDTKNSNGDVVLYNGGYFNHIKDEFKNENRGDGYHNLEWEQNNMYWIAEKTDFGGYYSIDEYRGAFGEGVLRLVIKGQVKRIDSNMAKISISKAGVYFRDSYDFIDEDEYDSQELGCWSNESPYVTKGLFSSECTEIYNNSFQNYNINNGYDKNRGNFRIFSTMKEFYVNESFNVKIDDSIENKNSTNIHIENFYNAYDWFFGNKNGGNYTCYTNLICQNFDTGNIIAVDKEDGYLWYYSIYYNSWYSYGVFQ